MCVLLCANTNVRQWFDVPAARAYRQSLQVSSVWQACMGADAQNSHEPRSRGLAESESDEMFVQHVMKRSAWLQAYCTYRAYSAAHGRCLVDGRASARDWPKALEAIAKTWGRLLSLVGLRW
jgi:hypothetical protein